MISNAGGNCGNSREPPIFTFCKASITGNWALEDPQKKLKAKDRTKNDSKNHVSITWSSWLSYKAHGLQSNLNCWRHVKTAQSMKIVPRQRQDKTDHCRNGGRQTLNTGFPTFLLPGQRQVGWQSSPEGSAGIAGQSSVPTMKLWWVL